MFFMSVRIALHISKHSLLDMENVVKPWLQIVFHNSHIYGMGIGVTETYEH